MTEHVWPMPTNLPPDAKKKWAEVEATRNPREKLRLLQEFLSLVPRHKGTAKLCVNVKKQIASLQEEIKEKKRKKAGRSGPKIFIEKEGAGQVVLLGVTKVGKSSLLSAVTNAKVAISDAPYTTREPVPGILAYKDIQFQIIEAPAVMEGSADGRAWGLQTLGLARNADGLVLMVDLAADAVDQLSLLVGELEKARILVAKPKARVEIERKYLGAGLRIILTGKLVDCSFGDVEELLKTYHFSDGVVKISGEATLDEIEDAIFESTVYKPAIVVANKLDAENAEEKLKMLKTYVGDKLQVIAVSCKDRVGLESIGEMLFKMLEIIRVYTKEPNKREHSKKPFILKKNATVLDLARSIHSDFRENFSHAKVWSKKLVFSPQKVGSTFTLDDEDIVEIHLK
ncbi:50S ribosome-binding GTPase [Candidatus Bathyarchaeota archaeon]|nr:50S ribosome-binding GTPase [Candidatus Bathyarchaeota archaeon]